jgi:hypothetical protein
VLSLQALYVAYKQVKNRITDGSILTLIKQFLKSGIMIGSTFERSDIGSPQGGLLVRYYQIST